MLEERTIKRNESNKSIFLKYISYLITGLNFSDSNKDIITINKFNFLKKVQEFPLETDKFIITSDKKNIHDNNIKDNICFSEKGFFENLEVLIGYVIDNSDSYKENMQLSKEIYPETGITSFIIKTINKEKKILEVSFKNISLEKSKEIWNWFSQIKNEANKIIFLQNTCLQSKDTNNSNQIIYSRNNKTPVNSKLTPKSIKDKNNSDYNAIIELIEQINSTEIINNLFYAIKNKVNPFIKSDIKIKYLVKNYHDIYENIIYLKELEKSFIDIQNQNSHDEEIISEIKKKFNSLSEKDLLIKVLGNIVEKASSILDGMKKNVEHMTLGQLIQKEDLNLNKLKRIMNSDTEHFFNKEKTKKPEEIIDNNKRTSEKNECTSEKRMVDGDNHYEHNNKKAKKSDICHIKDEKMSPEKEQPIGYLEEKSTKEVNNKTNELHSKLKLDGYYIYPRFRDKKIAKDPKEID